MMTTFLLKILIIFALTIIIDLVCAYAIKKLTPRDKTHDALKTFLQAFAPLSHLLILGYGTLLLLKQTAVHYEFPFTSQIHQATELFLVIMIAWLLLRWKHKYESLLLIKSAEGKSKIKDESLISGISKLLSIIIFAIASLTILEIFGKDYSVLLAFGGLSGLAVSWAAKDVISNFFGGLMLHINRPFSIGDRIRSPNKNFEGVVEQIGWYMTRIRTYERNPSYIPNALITDAIIENPGRMYHRRILTTIGVRYQDYPLVKGIISDIEKMLKGHPLIVQNQMLLVHLVGFNQYSIDIEVYCFTRKAQIAEFRTIQQEILFKIADIVQKNGAEIAFPTQTLHIESPESLSLSELSTD